jgi:hypothetical protein
MKLKSKVSENILSFKELIHDNNIDLTKIHNFYFIYIYVVEYLKEQDGNNF